MGMRMPETCWAVFKWQVLKLRSCCICFVDSVESMMMHGLANPRLSECSDLTTCFLFKSYNLIDFSQGNVVSVPTVKCELPWHCSRRARWLAQQERTCTLIYLTNRDIIWLRHQAEKRSQLFYSAVSRGPRILIEDDAGNVRMLAVFSFFLQTDVVTSDKYLRCWISVEVSNARTSGGKRLVTIVRWSCLSVQETFNGSFVKVTVLSGREFQNFFWNKK